MGSLSNLFISQSYISLLHLGSDNTASSTPTEIQDGLGNGIGITVNTAGDVALAGTLDIKRGLDITGSVKINTAVTASTPSYVNSGNYFTDSIIRITGSFASGTQQQPTVNEVQIGWPVYGDGLTTGAVVIDKQYINSQFVELTINQNTAQWFGEYYFTNPNVQYYNFSVSGSEDITGSLWVRDTINSNIISASNLYVSGTIYAFEIDTTIVSSSIVFTSGSNIIGDEANVDTQTLVGRVIVTGSLEVTSSIKATNDISSSTISGLGNATLYSASVATTITNLSSSVSGTINTLSTSVDSRLDLLENFSSSQYKADSASFQSQITTNSASFAAYSSSLVSTFATNAFVLANTASLSSSITTTIDNLSSSIFQTDATQSNNITTVSASAWGAFQSASAFSASAVAIFATTGSNTFKGTEIISGSLEVTGSMVYSGSVRGEVIPLSISSQTASIDCSRGNFFTLTLASGSNTFINATNIAPGSTISLKIKQPSVSFGSVTFGSSFKFPINFPYIATPLANTEDIISMISYDSTALYANAVNTLT